MHVYLAGPDVFLQDALEIGRCKVALCAKHRMTGLFPLDNAIDLTAPDVSLQIFCANQAMMTRSDAIIANLTPFRGPSADAGTVYELGYMAGLGRACFGYSNDPRDYVTRMNHSQFDSNRHAVEDFDLPDNLMIAHSVALCGGSIVTPDVAPDDPWHDLVAFEICLERLTRHFRSARE